MGIRISYCGQSTRQRPHIFPCFCLDPWGSLSFEEISIMPAQQFNN